MNLKYSVLLFFVVFVSFSASSQIISGTIRSDFNPVAYATIGVKEKLIGTISNEKVKNENFTGNEELIISCVGYEDKTILLSDFLKLPEKIIDLKINKIELDEITVKPKKVKEKIYGNRSVAKLTSITLFTRNEEVDDALGREIGVALKVDSNIKLKYFNVYVLNQFRNVKFRLNFYDFTENDQPQLIPLPEDMIFNVDVPKGWVKVDLSSYHIFLEGRKKLGVSIQWLESERIKEKDRFLQIPAGPGINKKGFMRYKSEAPWIFLNANPSIYLTADSYYDK
jgi:hypothetical protein